MNVPERGKLVELLRKIELALECGATPVLTKEEAELLRQIPQEAK